MDLKLRIEEKKKGWKWYLDDAKKKICIADSANIYWSTRNGAKRGFYRFKERLSNSIKIINA